MNMRLAAGLALLFLISAAAPIAAFAQTLVITPIAVIDVGEAVVQPDMTVVVSGDRITAVGPLSSVDIPGDARVVDGTGKYLIPGLWDMHVHTTTDRNTREVIFPLLIAHGITGIRSMAADCFETGEPNCREEGSSATLATIEDVRRWRREMASGDLVGPRVVAGSYYVNSPPPGEPSTAQYPRTAEHGREHARLLRERGVDFIKVYDMLSREAYFALAEEATRLGLPFAGHVPIAVRASEASEAGQRSIEHLGMGNVLEECSSREDDLRQRLIAVFQEAEIGSRRTSDGSAILPLNLEMLETHDAVKCATLAERFVRNGTWLVPNLMVARLPSELGRGWREDSYARFLPPDERRYFEWAEETYARDLGTPAERAPIVGWVREVTGAMHRTGVRMLAGSDAGETGIFWGIGLHQELELLVAAGLTEAEALRAATLAPAEFLKRTASLGTVEEGKLADLVLLDANPLEDISNTQRIAAVVANGRFFDREALDGLLADAERAATASSEADAPGTPAAGEVVPRFEPANCWFDTAAIEAGPIRCGYVQVPEDRARPDGRVIRLAVAVAEPLEATAPQPPVAMLPGGPGGSMLRRGRGIPALRGWVGDRTVVIFDYRGTGETGPLMCPALSITESDIASLDLSLEEANTLERGAYLACRDELLNQGIDPAAYHGGSIAEDVRAIREALGYAEWDLFGGSYGSWIARRVLREDPQGTRSATIMAGPPADPTQLLTRDVPFFHRALNHVFSRCDADPSCASRYPRIEQLFYETHAQLERDPWTVPVDPDRFRRSRFTVNGQDFIRMMYWLLGDGDFMHLPALVTAFHDRDEDVVRRVIDRQYGGLSSTFSTGMMYSVECYESHTPESRAERERLATPYPAPLLAIRDFLAPCEDLHPARASAAERTLIRSEIPTLIISAELDAMGPPEVGDEIHRLLRNSFHVVLPGAAHNAAFGPAYQPCLKEIVTDFLAKPTRRPPAHCLDALPERPISLELPEWARATNDEEKIP